MSKKSGKIVQSHYNRKRRRMQRIMIGICCRFEERFYQLERERNNKRVYGTSYANPCNNELWSL